MRTLNAKKIFDIPKQNKLKLTLHVCHLVPRKSSLFQADIYPDTLSNTPAMSVNEWFVLGSNAKPILMSMQKDMPSSNDVVVMRRTITNGTPTAVKLLKRDEKEKDEEEEKNNKYRRQTTELVIENRGSKVFDNNLSKKFAFLSASSAPDYRPYYGDRVQNKQEKTNTNQSTKIQQLQSIFGQTAVVTTTAKENGNGNENSNILDNTALIHAENEVRIDLNLYL